MTRERRGPSWGRTLLIAVTLVLPAVAYTWGFTVDDALVAARVAHQWSTGKGYVFNPDGPVVDAVTPLGWVVLLLPFGKAGTWAAFGAARWIGTLGWLLAVIVTIREVLGAGNGRSRFWAVALLGLATPPAAWASSGMETGLVALLGALALRQSASAPWAAGLAAAWRPELVPWAVVMGVGRAWVKAGRESATAPSPWRLLSALPSVLLPAALVAAVRCLCFGSPAPLSVFAKPPDLAFGAWYVAAGLLWTGPVWLLVAGRAWAGIVPRDRVVGVALLAHLGAMCLAGGDWMPMFRLWVPVWPSLTVLGAALSVSGRWWANALRFTAGAAVSLCVAVTTARQGRGVLDTRRDWAAELAPKLDVGDVIATLDVGWVGATTDGTIVDFAGITDPSVARLAGPHHAKRIDPGFLERRRVSVLVLLVAPDVASPTTLEGRRYARSVEERLRMQTGIEAFKAVAEIRSPRREERYVVLRRDAQRLSAAMRRDGGADSGCERCAARNNTE